MNVYITMTCIAIMKDGDSYNIGFKSEIKMGNPFYWSNFTLNTQDKSIADAYQIGEKYHLALTPIST